METSASVVEIARCMEHGQELFTQRHYQEALAVFEHVLRLDGDHAPA